MAKKTCPACDSSGSVPLYARELCEGCLLEARTAIRRAADEGRVSGGEWPPGFAAWYAHTPIDRRRRRLTLDVLRAVEIVDAFACLSSEGPRRKR